MNRRPFALAAASLCLAQFAFGQAPQLAPPPPLPPSEPAPTATTPAPTSESAEADELLGSNRDIPMDIEAENVNYSKGDNPGETNAIASGNVKISYGATTIYADTARYDGRSKDVIVTGNVRIYQNGRLAKQKPGSNQSAPEGRTEDSRLITADRAVYNLDTKDVTAASIRGDSLPFKFSGSSMQNIPGSSNGYLIKEGFFTTSDLANPDWSIRAKRVRVYDKDRVIFNNVKIYLGETPILWVPYLYQSLNQKNAFMITPGYSSVWGLYALSTYTFPLNETIGATLHLDLRSDRGAAAGFDMEWETGEKKENWGRFRSYAIEDSSPDLNRTSLAREPIDPNRYRVSFQAKQYLTDDIYATVDLNLLSDERLLQDFYENEFREHPQPDNALAVTKLGEDYALTLLARKQLNEFFDGTERMPEIALDITRQPFFRTGIFYQGETSAGRYNRNFADSSVNQDYDSGRIDTFHQFSYPRTFGGWLSVMPTLGIRGTWYSESGTIRAFDEVTTQNLTNGGTQEVHKVVNRLVEEGSVFRPVVNAGLEVSFKASKAFEQVQSRAWGLDGLRHVIQPFADLSFVRTGADGRDLLQFDRFQRSSQPPPIDFPAFNGIDSIDNWNILRLGVRNRLQTRRDNSTFNWFEMSTFVDIRFDRPDFGLDPDLGTFSNVVNRIRWTPLSWMTLTLDAQLPLLDEGFNEVNSRATFFVNDRLQFNIGHRYLEGNVLFADSSLMDFGAYYRLSDNWGFSFRETYEFNDNVLESQRYELHRDLSSWVASLGVLARSNQQNGKEVNDYGVILTFTLKDLPAFKLPLSIDPTGGVGGGSGKNR